MMGDQTTNNAWIKADTQIVSERHLIGVQYSVSQYSTTSTSTWYGTSEHAREHSALQFLEYYLVQVLQYRYGVHSTPTASYRNC